VREIESMLEEEGLGEIVGVRREIWFLMFLRRCFEIGIIHRGRRFGGFIRKFRVHQ